MNGICRIYALIMLLLGMSAGNLTGWAQVVQQATLTGRITNATDGKPLPFASVYLNGTTRGTATDETGQFTLASVPFGANELVISYTGFSAVRQPIRVTELKPQPIAIALFPVENQLTGVVVTAKKDKVWLRQVEQFERDLIGTSPFARQCKLVNPEVLDFNESSNILSATAREPLVINNQALGFQLTYTLLAFRSQRQTGKVVFGGATLFKELTPESQNQQKLWQQNRQKAYQGSLRHLLASLATGTYEREGFLVYQTNPARPLPDNPPPLLATELGRHLKPFDPAVMVAPGTLAHERWLVSNSPLEVLYTRIASRESPYRDAQYAFSQLVLPQLSIGFTVTGQITAPRGFDAVGYLSGDRLATALPNDWQKDTPTAAQLTARRDSIRTQPNLRPVTNAGLDSLVQRWNRQVARLTPVVFLHIDKPLYLTNTRMWLSGYVINAQLQRCDTALVGPALNVELWSSVNTLVQHQWLPVSAGRTVGSFALSDTLTTGPYWLRAYTEADREQGKAAFERPLWLVNRKDVSVDEAAGQPVAALTEPNSALGSYVEEAPGAPYRTTVALDSNECVLALQSRSKTQFPTVFVLIEGRGKLVQSARVPVREAATTVRWSTRTWPSGTAWVSLLDSTGRVWARRSVRVPERAGPIMASVALRKVGNADAAQPSVLLITLQDDAGRPVSAQISVAVTDADQVPPDSLAASLPTHLMAMENRRITSSATGTAATGITLHGQVSTAEKFPVNVVVMVSGRQGVVSRATQTDADGYFQVGQLALSDTALATVQVTSRRGKPIEATVTFDSPAASFGQLPNWTNNRRLPAHWKSLVDAAKQRQPADLALYRPDDGRQLREVAMRTAQPVDRHSPKVKGVSQHQLLGYSVPLPIDLTASHDVLAWEPLASTNQLGQVLLPLPRTGSVRLLRVTIQGISSTGQAIGYVQTLPVDVLR